MPSYLFRFNAVLIAWLALAWQSAVIKLI